MTRSELRNPSNAGQRRTACASGRSWSSTTEKDIVDLITYNLQRNGYDVLCALNGTEALDLAQKHVPDLVVLDLMLPGIDGTEVARRLRPTRATATVPIIMLTAKGEETDVVVGLTLAPDDYVTKPFSMKILLARLSTVLRRAEQGATADAAEAGILKAGPLTIDTSKHEVSVNGEPCAADPDRVQAPHRAAARAGPRADARPVDGQGDGLRRVRHRPRHRRPRHRDPQEARQRKLAGAYRPWGGISIAGNSRRRRRGIDPTAGQSAQRAAPRRFTLSTAEPRGSARGGAGALPPPCDTRLISVPHSVYWTRT
jgi:DNA-binding response OmpR family regulator